MTDTGDPEPRIDTEILHAVFEYSHDAICIVDLDADRIVECNPAATELFGYSREELLSMAASDLHPHNFEAFQRFAERVIETGSGWTNELTCYGKDGREIPSEISATVYEMDSQTCLINIVRDISKRQKREQALQQENERLEMLANIVAHDLRNPLNVLSGHLQLARETGDDAHFEAMESALERADDIIDHSLVLTKQSQSVEQTESIRLSSVIESCWQNIDTHNADVTIDSDGTFQADPERLSHLLENLLRNSVDHSNGPVTVSVGVLEDGFYIADSGPGIPVDEREYIFESGYTTAEDGTGFGLAIVERMADAHDWAIDVTESERGGARFEITGVERCDSPDLE